VRPVIRDLALARVGTVVVVDPGQGVLVQWTPGYVVWLPAAKLNSGRYEQVAA
jgi:hypothetical protein